MKYILTLTILIFWKSGNSQNGLSKIEVKSYQRIDWYPEFSYNIGGRPSINYLTMKGISLGVMANYKPAISKKVHLVAGAGFYNYSFTKLYSTNSTFGKGNARAIDYPSTTEPVFTTDKYFYHTIIFNIGAEKCFDFKNSLTLTTGIELQNYYTISQKYHLASRDINFRKREARYFGNSLLITSSLLKRFERFQIGPSILVPVFDFWKKDKVFPGENNSESRNKWIRGVGWGISANFLLTNKKQ